MKKNIIKVAFVAAFALVAGYGVYTTQNEAKLSDLALDNVEALAYKVEGGTSNYECIAPLTAACSYELGKRLPGYKK